MDYPIRVEQDKPILQSLQEYGNVHTELDETAYLYFPFCFKSEGGMLFIVPIESVPTHIKQVMLRLGFKPNATQGVRTNEKNASHFTYELSGEKPAPIFIDFSNLSQDEKEVIVGIADQWQYGKQVVLQSEFEKKSKDAE